MNTVFYRTLTCNTCITSSGYDQHAIKMYIWMYANEVPHSHCGTTPKLHREDERTSRSGGRNKSGGRWCEESKDSKDSSNHLDSNRCCWYNNEWRDMGILCRCGWRSRCGWWRSSILFLRCTTAWSKKIEFNDVGVRTRHRREATISFIHVYLVTKTFFETVFTAPNLPIDRCHIEEQIKNSNGSPDRWIVPLNPWTTMNTINCHAVQLPKSSPNHRLCNDNSSTLHCTMNDVNSKLLMECIERLHNQSWTELFTGPVVHC